MSDRVYEGSNVKVIKEFFELKASDAIQEFKPLSDEDKQQLADGIRNGSFTY